MVNLSILLSSFLISPILLVAAASSVQSSTNSTPSALSPISRPSIDYASIGNKLEFVGDFDSVSFFDYPGQQHLLTSNTSGFNDSSNTLYYQDTSSNIVPLGNINGKVSLISAFKDSFIIVGDFSNLDLSLSQSSNSSVSVSSPLLYNSTLNEFLNLDSNNDISGDINAVFGDSSNNLIYFGGKLSYKQSYGAVIYNLTSRSLAKLPFKGFNKNSEINTISQVDQDSIVFGGYFYELGVPQLQFTNQTYFLLYKNSLLSNSSSEDNSTESVLIQTEQLVSFQYASISADNTESGHLDADSIICPSNSDNWLANSNQLGAWLATLPFSVSPSKIRIYNSKQDDTGVKMFRLYTSPSNSIMNLTYIDPSTGELAACDAWCPLISHSDLYDTYSNINDSTVTNVSFNNDGGVAASLSWSDSYQDFGFVNDLEVNYLNFQIVDYYGSNAGLNGIQMFTRQISTFANNTLNENHCGSYGNSSYSETTGDGWELSVTGQYMINNVNDISTAASDHIGVTFYPNISYSGNYSINYITPGCQSDGTCDSRGTVDVSMYDEKGTVINQFTSAQTNQFEKIENLWNGHLNVTSGRPKVHIEVANSGSGSASIVADKVAVTILGLDDLLNSTNSTIGRRKTNSTVTFNSTDYKIPLNGLFEYSLQNFTSFPTDYDTYNFSSKDFENKFVGNSSINQFGAKNLSNSSIINSLEYLNETLYIAGDFDSNNDGTNFLGLKLDGTDDNHNLKVSSVESFSDGLNGVVNQILQIGNLLFVVGQFNNTTSKTSLSSLSSSSNDDNNALTKVAVLENNNWVALDSGVSNANELSYINTVTIDGSEFFVFYDEDFENMSVWNSSNKKWYSNDDFNNTGLFLNITSADKSSSTNSSLISGHLAILGLMTSNTASLNKGNKFAKSSISFSSGSQNSVSQVLYVNDTFTVIGGNFTTSNNMTNLVLNNNGKISSFDDKIKWGNSTVNSISKEGNNRYLFVGLNGLATFEGNQNSNIIIYDLEYHNFTMPGAITKQSSTNNAKINAFYFYEKQYKLFVAGDFDTASSMACNSFCFYDMTSNRWENDASNGFSSGVVNYMNETNNELFLIGSFAMDNAKGYFATYDFGKESFTIDHSLYDASFSSSSNSKRDVEVQSNSTQDALANKTGIPGEIKKYILVDNSDNSGNRMLVLGNNFVSGYNKSEWVRLDRLTDEISSSSTFNKFQLINIESNKSSSSGSNSDSNKYFDASQQMLLVVGNIIFNNYGNVSMSAAIFNGTNWLPYIYTTKNSGGSGSGFSDFLVNKAISVDSVEENSVKHAKLDRGWIVFIGLALSVGTMMLLVLFALLILFWKRKHDGTYDDKQRIEEDEMVQTVPPDQLLNEMEGFKFTNEKAH